MGFEPAAGPVHIIQLSCSWNNVADDNKVYKVMSKTMQQIKVASILLNVANDWAHMNYASQFQDVIASYGNKNNLKLKSTAMKYDPKAGFRKLQPGYFKLGRAPVVDARYISH